MRRTQCESCGDELPAHWNGGRFCATCRIRDLLNRPRPDMFTCTFCRKSLAGTELELRTRSTCRTCYLLGERATAYRTTRKRLYALYEAQAGCCSVCGVAHPILQLHVDHDHKTKKVRNLLCPGCNIGLGQARDNVTTLMNMVRYLCDTPDSAPDAA